MQKTLLFFLMFSASLAFAQTEEDAVKQVVTSAYIEGIHNNGNLEDVKKGFHPSFNMLRMMENDVKPYSITEWIAAIEKRRADNPNQTSPRTDGKFVAVDVSGNAATVKLELYRDNKKIFTDYISLYKFTEGWRIVSKTFYRHP